MKLLLDTCVIYPTVMRQMLLGASRVTGWTPLWSERILEEWARAARKIGPTGEMQARAEIALVRATWPKSEISWVPSLETRLWLPDVNDRHILAAAIAGSADLLITSNARDFPRATLFEEGLDRLDPDALLLKAYNSYPDQVSSVGNDILFEARRLSGKDWEIRDLFKKARLPRLAKVMATAPG
ncbi:MAG: PIN domain-containing protein [Paracoccaceae bacterium]|nr:PIN domain-containing protein [Paracoccaceae bacterium]